MLIQELTTQQSWEVLRGMSFGRLGCVRGGQPYVVPIHFAVDDHYLYGFCVMGKKVEWMRANPLVCVEADQIVSSHQWVSIVVSGKYEELPATPEWGEMRTLALTVLPLKTKWWEPWPTTIMQGDAQRPLMPLFYSIHVVEISGRRAIPDRPNADKTAGTRGLVKSGFLQRILKQFRPKPTSHADEKDGAHISILFESPHGRAN